jgi:hypothetical protein
VGIVGAGRPRDKHDGYFQAPTGLGVKVDGGWVLDRAAVAAYRRSG